MPKKSSSPASTLILPASPSFTAPTAARGETRTPTAEIASKKALSHASKVLENYLSAIDHVSGHGFRSVFINDPEDISNLLPHLDKFALFGFNAEYVTGVLIGKGTEEGPKTTTHIRISW
jgi:hypothetical protein